MKFANTIKNSIRQLIHKTARSRPLYSKVWHPLIRVSALAHREHRRNEMQAPADEISAAYALIKSQTVLHGPFAGMKYPRLASSGSVMFPKLVGSYERELQALLSQIVQQDYKNVIDIGCAEGYYAVGLAMAMPQSTIYAWDTNAEALEMCREMAALNGVESRICFGGHCDTESLCRITAGGRTLLLCDCEGYEESLFSVDTCRALSSHDLLIEVHDFIKPYLSATLRNRLTCTHDIEVVRSIPDFLRPAIFKYDELREFTESTQIALLSEMRPLEMEWFFCSARQTA